MDSPFLSYLVTCKNDGKSILPLLSILKKYGSDDECIILDDYSDDEETLSVLDSLKTDNFFKIYKNHLNKNYGEHKNFGKSKCSGKYIFQIDSDEIPKENLLLNIKDIIIANPQIELYWVPRINDFKGVTLDHARQWGWRLSEYDGRYIVNWPDRQTRIFLNVPRIKWVRPLHEKIEGAMVITNLPDEFDFALIHNKTIERQIETNIRYNREFSEELNRGFKV